MEIKYIKAKFQTELPCLMKNEFEEIFLVTRGWDGKNYVTRISGGEENVNTWESDLKGYKPLPEGTKVEIVN